MKNKTFLFILMIIFMLSTSCKNQEVIYIGLAGPMTGNGESFGRAMLMAMNMLINEVNSTGGINGKKIKLVIKDDQNNPALAKKIADEFVSEGKVSVIIGHCYSSCCLAAQDTYRKAGIPSISSSATNENVTRNSPYMFRTIFSDSFQGQYIAHYARELLGARTGVIIHDDDQYGSGLKDYVLSAKDDIGLKIDKVYSYNNNDPDYSFIDDLKSLKADVIFLLGHSAEGADIISLIRKKSIETMILGSDGVGSQLLLKKIGKTSRNLLCITPASFDVAGEEAQIFFKKYRRLYQMDPPWEAPFTYDAGKVAVEALRISESSGIKVADALRSFNSIENSVQGVTGKIYFDEHGNVKKSLVMSSVKNGSFISTFIQWQELDIAHLTEKEKEKYTDDKRLYKMSGVDLFKTNVVYTGIDLIDFIDFSEKDMTFTADLYLWVRWRGDIDPTGFEFINGKIDDISIEKKKDYGDMHYICYRVKGTFKGNFDLRKYPFDEQVLRINFRHKSLSRMFLIYVVDVLGLSETLPNISIRNWKIIDTWQYSGIKTRETTLGDPEMLGKKIERASSTYGFAIRIKRQAWSFLIKMLVPLVLVMLVCYIQFFFPPNQLTGRISIGVTTLLTAIAYHLTQARQLAGIGYIIKSDMIFWLAYIMIFLSILEATISFSFYTKGMTKISARLDTFSKVSFFILYIIFLAIVIII